MANVHALLWLIIGLQLLQMERRLLAVGAGVLSCLMTLVGWFE